MRRDDLKSVHFPKYHPGIKYKEKGDRSIKNMFMKSIENLSRSKDSVSVDLSCQSMELVTNINSIEKCEDVTLATSDDLLKKMVTPLSLSQRRNLKHNMRR